MSSTTATTKKTTTGTQEVDEPSSTTTAKQTTMKTATASLPLVSWKHGLSRKADAMQSSSWMSMALTLDGRDKITKVLQYVSRFLAWYYYKRAHNLLSARFAGLKVSLTNSRKAFRLGKAFMEFQRLYKMNLFSTPMNYCCCKASTSTASTTTTTALADTTTTTTASKTKDGAGAASSSTATTASSSSSISSFSLIQKVGAAIKQAFGPVTISTF